MHVFLLLFFLCEMSSFIRFFHHLTCCILSVTVVAAAVADGTFLPYQVVLMGKTCHLKKTASCCSTWAGALHGQITTGPILRHPSFSLTLSISPIA